MGTFVLIIIAVILVAAGDYTFVWIFSGIFVIALIGALFSDGGKSSAKHERPRTRIRIPQYYLPDQYRCTVCGAGFHTDTMTCPHCGVRFNHTKTDDQAFIEQADFFDWMDEKDEEGR